MRSAFTLITAIFLMVLVATLMALALSLSTQSVRQTGNLYLQEQAQLLAKGATEIAMLAVSGHDNSADCIETINMRFPEGNPLFDINLSLYYIGTNLPCHANHILANNIASAESNGTVLIDTFVRYREPDSNESITYHRRTLQKP